ncbi:iron uptake system component EfeO [Thermomonospora echinospora]|uniref:Iron uptake system component EfeO n=1 Tax=Thermomonospora echinospora TaxID=1992 RepID=A0A1H5ZYL0_9ACTN|nr:iron uptake system protein EfeO [Thermomonospora echinospora]SEG40546.1 iron uptake system component EfeO [Thermomonospora echinospora]
MPSVRLAGLAALMIPLLAACGGTDDAGGGAAAATAIDATDTACEVGRTEFPAGTIDFKVTNKGSKVTEVYVYGPGDKIMTERENIGPGTSVDFTVQLDAGKYQIACKPGMVGDGIRKDITVTGRAAAGDPQLAKAAADYKVYVTAQVDDTLARTREFVKAVKDGDVAQAKRLYAPSRLGWESVEPVAESFGDLDPRIDAREADLEEGQEWTGWHKLEKALWKTGSVKGEEATADRLVKDLEELRSRIPALEFKPVNMANGAKELLDEISTGKITGEEEAFSHTDLADFKANLDGAQKVHELLKPVVQAKDPALAVTLDEEFGKVHSLLARYEKGDGYVSYDTVGQDERKKLSDAVNGLHEPVSRIAGVISR